jgi:hypothetical protein
MTTRQTSIETSTLTQTSRIEHINTTTKWETFYNTSWSTSWSTSKTTSTTTTWSTGYTLTQSILYDGANDGTRFLGAGGGDVCNLFNGGGTVVLAFKCTGATGNSSEHMINGAWGGGWNWIISMSDIQATDFQIRFRHDFSGSNYIAEWASADGARPFRYNEWYLISVSYNNDSTSRNAALGYGRYGDNVWEQWETPFEHQSPTGTKRTASYNYPAIAYGKGSNTRPYKGNVSMCAMWDEWVPPDEIEDFAFDGGAPADWAEWDSNLLFFHDMTSVSGTTITPAVGSTNYNLTMVNGATTDSGDYPS